MARVREVGAPEGSPQRSLRPPRARTAENFVKKWGYGGDGAAGGTLAPCAPRGWFSPRESRGALPSGSPGAAPRACPRCLASKGCRAVAAAADSAPLDCAEDAPIPNGGNPARPDPTATTPAG